MIVAAYFTLLSSVIEATAEATSSSHALTHRFLKNDLASECRFDLGDSTYDLCPLILQRSLEDIDGGSEISEEGRGRWSWSQRRYTFSFLTANGDPNCPRGTWVCMEETRGSDHYPPEQTSVTKHIPIAGPSFSGISVALRDDLTTKPGPRAGKGKLPYLPLTHLSLLMNDPAHAEIEFECANESEHSHLSFVEESGGLHKFRWRSKHSCPLGRATTDNVLSAYGEGEDESSDKTEGDGETDLVSPPPHRKFRPWMAATLFIALFMLTTALVVSTSPHAKNVVRSRISSFSEGIVERLPGLESKARFAISYLTIPHPLFRSLRWRIPRLARSLIPLVSWRTSESRLVRWAQEDIASLGLMEDEDIMVNGRGAFKIGDADEWEGAEMDEFIPLRSAKEIQTAKDYGSRGRSARFW